MQKHSLLEVFMNGIIFLALVGSLAHALFVSLYLPMPFYKTLMVVMLFYIILFTLFLRLSITLPISVAIILGIWILNRPLPEDWSLRLLEFLEWAILYPQGLVSLNEALVLPFAYLAIGVLSIIFYIFAIRIRSFIIPLLFGTILLGVEWFLGHTYITPYIWIFAYSMVLIMASKRYRKLPSSANLPSHGLWLVWTMPFAIVIIITSIILIPRDTTTLKWHALEDITENIREKRFNTSTFTHPREPFRLSTTGFANSTDELGGPVKLEGDIVLEVRSPFPTYLRGSILNNYTGTSWQDTIEDKRYRLSDKYWTKLRDRAFDMDEGVWYNIDKSNDYTDNLYLPYGITIKHVGIKTSVLFNAQFTKNILSENNKSLTPFFNTKSESFTSREITKEEPYIIEGIAPNVEAAEFESMIKEYSSESLKEESDGNGELSKQDYIAQNYTQLPDTLPNRVVALALSIVEDADSSYEKAIKIQNYLRDSFSYTLDTPYTPPNRDFVDYFLFDLEEGYCTYFATAMAVMGRSVGLPTRYIEGFSMPMKPYKGDIYNVRKSDAHAWVEIYFPNIGWLPFDPTPRSREAFHGGTTGSGSSYMDYWEEYLRNNDENQQGSDLDLSTSQVPDKDLEKGSPWGTLILIALLALILFTIIVLIFLWYFLTRIRPIRYSNIEKLIFYYDQILWLLSLYGFPMLSGETPYVYAERVDTWLINKDTNMTGVTHILVECQFGSQDPTEEQVNILIKLYRDIERDTIQIIGLPLFLIESIKKLLSHF